MSIFSIFIAAIGLGFLVLIHELGHLWVARRRGMNVETFSIGFGRPIVQWKWRGVQWQVGWLPFGGYVRITGMEVGRAVKQGIDLYAIKGGFFSKSPWARIQVALAGPVANLLLALVLFTGVWALGGRVRPLAEVTHRVGWVDPQSELFRAGVRPGDWIDRCDGSNFQPSRDWLCAAIAGDNQVSLSGYRIDDMGGRWEPFSLQMRPYWQGGGAQAAGSPGPGTVPLHRTMGIESAANYLVYPGGNGIAGLESGDRLVWMDGVLLYSARELSVMLNDNRILVTVERGGQQQLVRVPRVRVADLWLTQPQRDELSDWRHAAGLQPRLNDLWAIPYAVSGTGLVVAPYNFIDEEERLRTSVPPVSGIEAPLQVGDRIVAIGGVPVDQPSKLFAQVQERRVHLIVDRATAATEKPMVRQVDDQFFPADLVQSLPSVVASIGQQQPLRTSGSLRLIGPIEPIRLSQMVAANPDSAMAQEWTQRTAQIQRVDDPAKRLQQTEALRAMEQRYLLGITLGDLSVRTNPLPQQLFFQTISETGEVLWGAVHGGIPAKGFAGPIGIVEVLHYGWLNGVQEGLYWLGVISINLGLLNLLPLPVLDGGTICLALWEQITRRRVKPRTMERLVVPFIVLLIGFFLFVTYNDLSRLLSG